MLTAKAIVSFRWVCGKILVGRHTAYGCSQLHYCWCFPRASKESLTGWLDEMRSYWWVVKTMRWSALLPVAFKRAGRKGGR